MEFLLNFNQFILDNIAYNLIEECMSQTWILSFPLLQQPDQIKANLLVPFDYHQLHGALIFPKGFIPNSASVFLQFISVEETGQYWPCLKTAPSKWFGKYQHTALGNTTRINSYGHTGSNAENCSAQAAFPAYIPRSTRKSTGLQAEDCSNCP